MMFTASAAAARRAAERSILFDRSRLLDATASKVMGGRTTSGQGPRRTSSRSGAVLETHGKTVTQSFDRIGVVQLVTLHGMPFALGRVERQHAAAVDVDAVSLLRQTPLERGPCTATL